MPNVRQMETVYYLLTACLVLLLLAVASSTGVTWTEVVIMLVFEVFVIVFGRVVLYLKRKGA